MSAAFSTFDTSMNWSRHNDKLTNISLAISFDGATIASSHVRLSIDERLSSDQARVCVCSRWKWTLDIWCRKKQVMNSKNVFLRINCNAVLVLPSNDWQPLQNALNVHRKKKWSNKNAFAQKNVRARERVRGKKCSPKRMHNNVRPNCDPVRNSAHSKSNFDPVTALCVNFSYSKLVQPTTFAPS